MFIGCPHLNQNAPCGQPYNLFRKRAGPRPLVVTRSGSRSLPTAFDTSYYLSETDGAMAGRAIPSNTLRRVPVSCVMPDTSLLAEQLSNSWIGYYIIVMENTGESSLPGSCLI